MNFGNGRAVRNLFGEMKTLLARRLMQSPAPDQSGMDKETLITFTQQDVPGPDWSETLFHLSAPSRDAREYQASGIVINTDPSAAE
jgi:hypothetical protein